MEPHIVVSSRAIRAAVSRSARRFTSTV